MKSLFASYFERLSRMRSFHRTLSGCFLVFLAIHSLPVFGQTEVAQALQEKEAASNFDEKFDDWPTKLKIDGTVVLGGGGKLPPQATTAFARATNGNKQVTAIIFQANAPANDGLNQTVEDLNKRFTTEKSSSVWLVDPSQTSLSEKTLASLASADGLWVDADSVPTESQENAIQQLLKAATKLVDRGGIICVNGGLAERFGKFTMGPLPTEPPVFGANIVLDSILKTNFNEEALPQLLSALTNHRRCVGIGIPSNTAVILRGRKMQLYGNEAATFCLADSQQYPKRIKQLKQAKSRRSSRYDTVFDLTAWRREAIERTLAPFPAQRPPTPNLENGTLVIVGGGGTPNGLMNRIVRLAGGKEARMVYIPCAESDQVAEPRAMLARWRRMGVKSATWIHTKDRQAANSDEELLAKLRNATGLWFGGGRQWNFVDSYYGTEAHRLMKNVLERGGVVGGSSAGASVLAKYMCRANPVANFDIMAPGYERGLGFIEGIAIDQHFSQRNRHKDMTSLKERYPQLLGLGIDESTAVVVNNSNAQVVGKGKVHFYDRQQPVAKGALDYTALTAGGKYDLAKRKVIDDDQEAGTPPDDPK